jgi:hypothetical protein
MAIMQQWICKEKNVFSGQVIKSTFQNPLHENLDNSFQKEFFILYGCNFL